MKKITLLWLALAMLLSATVISADGKEEPKKETQKETKLVNQTLCPVMGGKIDSTAFTDIQGQRVYHCCPMCSQKLKNDPDKYFKEAAANNIVFENIQKTCPVSDMELTDKKHELYFEGRRLYFCSENCIGEFSKDPQTYLKKMLQTEKEEK